MASSFGAWRFLSEFKKFGLADYKIEKPQIGASQRVGFKYVVAFTGNGRIKRERNLEVFYHEEIVFY
jgi:hypothetical protein